MTTAASGGVLFADISGFRRILRVGIARFGGRTYALSEVLARIRLHGEEPTALFSATVTLPMWLVVLIGVLSILAAIDRFILPSARWLLRRRLDRAIEDLNTRLKLRIQPFKLAKRQALIDQLVFDPDVLAEIERYAAANKLPRQAVQDMARRYAREIVPSFSAYAYFGFATRAARWLSTMLYRVRL